MISPDPMDYMDANGNSLLPKCRVCGGRMCHHPRFVFVDYHRPTVAEIRDCAEMAARVVADQLVDRFLCKARDAALEGRDRCSVEVPDHLIHRVAAELDRLGFSVEYGLVDVTGRWG
jgi:hypothetical protein